jgi:hypothetical protein
VGITKLAGCWHAVRGLRRACRSEIQPLGELSFTFILLLTSPKRRQSRISVVEGKMSFLPEKHDGSGSNSDDRIDVEQVDRAVAIPMTDQFAHLDEKKILRKVRWITSLSSLKIDTNAPLWNRWTCASSPCWHYSTSFHSSTVRNLPPSHLVPPRHQLINLTKQAGTSATPKSKASKKTSN